MQGLPAITILAAACGALVAGNIISLAAEASATRSARIAEHNLAQAERLLAACLESRPLIIGTAIYACATHRMHLTTRDVPEAAELQRTNP